MIDVDGTTGSDTLAERLLLAGATLLLAVFPAAHFVFQAALLLAPVPLAVLHARHGLKYGIGTAVAASFASSLVALSPLVFAQSLLVLGLGVALGEGIRDGLSAKMILVVGTLAALGAMLLLSFMVERIAGTDMFDLLRDIWEQALEGVLANETGVPSETVEQFRRWVREEIAFMQRTLPASLFLSSLSLAAFDFALVRRILERLPGDERAAGLRLPPFGEWRFGMGTGIGLLLGWLLPRWVAPDGPMATLALNVAMVCGTLVAVQGMATFWHFLGRTRLGKGWRLVIAVLVLLLALQGAALLLVAAGLIDMVFDVRRLGRRA